MTPNKRLGVSVKGPKAWPDVIRRSLPGNHHLEEPYAESESEHNGPTMEEFEGGQTGKNQVAAHLWKECPHRVIPKEWNRAAVGCRADVELIPSEEPIVIQVGKRTVMRYVVVTGVDAARGRVWLMNPRERSNNERGYDQAEPIGRHDAQESLPKVAAHAVLRG